MNDVVDFVERARRAQEAVNDLEAAALAVPMEQWIWDGHAGHLIVSRWCEFQLNTRIGDYRISTIGDYFPRDSQRGEGAKPTEVGFNRTHETFVFRVSGDGPGEVDSYSEIDSASYNDCEDARRGHWAMCLKYAALRPGDEQ
jgi:hypothetical protein